MPDKWVVDSDYPTGHLVAMSVKEEKQLDRDQKAGAASVAAQAVIEAAIDARLAERRKARKELANGVIFASLSTSERHIIEMLLQEAP